ncbi:MAG: hypothetical protein ACFE8N_05640 [Promethearchaeota archaeon]
MGLKLLLKNIVSNLASRKLTKYEAVDILISLIEESENPKDRVESINLLSNLNIKTNDIYNILEYCLVSDQNVEVKKSAIKGIMKIFNPDTTKKLFEWVLENELSVHILNTIIKSSGTFDENLSKVYEKQIILRYSNLFKLIPEEARFLRDLDLILCEGQEEAEIGKKLLEYIKNSKSISKLPKNFPPNTYKPCMKISNRHIILLNLSGCELECIPDSLKLLSNLKSLNLSYNNLSSVPESINSLLTLECLNLTGNKLTSVPKSINCLSNLLYFNLSFNPINPIPQSLLKLAKNKFSDRYILEGVIPSESHILGLLEILTGFHLSKLNKLRDFEINEEFTNTYKINEEGHITGIYMYDFELNNPIISIIPGQICDLKHLDVMVIPTRRIEFIPNYIRNIASPNIYDIRYINR